MLVTEWVTLSSAAVQNLKTDSQHSTTVSILGRLIVNHRQEGIKNPGQPLDCGISNISLRFKILRADTFFQ